MRVIDMYFILFPNLQYIEFQMRTAHYPEGLAALYENLPKIRSITFDELWINKDEDYEYLIW